MRGNIGLLILFLLFLLPIQTPGLEIGQVIRLVNTSEDAFYEGDNLIWNNETFYEEFAYDGIEIYPGEGELHMFVKTDDSGSVGCRVGYVGCIYTPPDWDMWETKLENGEDVVFVREGDTHSLERIWERNVEFFILHQTYNITDGGKELRVSSYFEFFLDSGLINIAIYNDLHDSDDTSYYNSTFVTKNITDDLASTTDTEITSRKISLHWIGILIAIPLFSKLRRRIL